jgi:hypothetical protein
MPKSALLFRWSLLLAPLMALAACSDNHHDDAGLHDAGGRPDAQPAADASPLDGNVPSLDALPLADAAPTPDAAPDAGVDASALVTVTVLDGGPVQNAIVLFHDETGHVLDVKMTGADGKTSGAVPTGGMVTTATVGSTTIMGVNPGDALIFGAITSTAPQRSAVLALTDTRPGYFEWGCGMGRPVNFGMTLPITVDPSCLPLEVLAIDFGKGLPYEYAVANDVNLPSSMTTTVTVGPWLMDFVRLHVETSSAPPNNNIGDHLSASVLKRGQPYPLQYPGIQFVQQDFSVPPAFGATGVLIDAGYMTTVSSSQAYAQIYQEQPTITATIAFDWGRMLALPGDLAIDRSNAARPTIAWSMRQASQATAVVASIIASGGTSWTIYAPASTQSPLRLPELPAQLSSLALSGSLTGSVIFYADDGLATWSQYLHEIGTSMDNLRGRLQRTNPATVRISAIGASP